MFIKIQYTPLRGLYHGINKYHFTYFNSFLLFVNHMNRSIRRCGSDALLYRCSKEICRRHTPMPSALPSPISTKGQCHRFRLVEYRLVDAAVDRYLTVGGSIDDPRLQTLPAYGSERV